jgi:hypothetical protein
MAGPWLYAISASAGRYFEVKGAKRIDVSVESYRALVASGKLATDRWWYIRQHWKKVEAGDELFIYSGDRNAGIIGYATIIGLEERADAWYLHIDLDLGKCRQLLDQPVAADTVRQWVPFPRSNVIDVGPVAAGPAA